MNPSPKIPPKVSVATCTYNRPEMLHEAVESLRRQTDPDWEHLLFDNGSTDPRQEEVLAWAKEDPRVTIFQGEKNRDQPAIFWNYLLDRARGRYFTILDDDNEKLPRFVEAMSKELDDDPALDLVSCGWVVVRESDRTNYHLNLSTCPSELDRISTCDGGATLFRRETFEKVGYFSEAIRTNEDWDWMRRAVHLLQMKHLHDCHATYRDHPKSRMSYCETLGNTQDIERVRARPLASTLGIRIVRPSPSRLTASQQDVTTGIDRALAAIPWLVPGGDLGVILSPLQLSDDDITQGTAGCAKLLSIHMEDPYALQANLDRVSAMVRSGREVWVATNDRATLPHYRDIISDRVLVCPSLSYDDSVFWPRSVIKPIDVLFCGYAYPSRKDLIRELLPHLGDRNVLLVGDGWNFIPRTPNIEILPTQDLPETYRLHARAKVVVCSHRMKKDGDDGPVEPETCNRGAMEGALGPRVFLDRKRPGHSFREGDVILYDNAKDLGEKIQNYLVRDPEHLEGQSFSVFCQNALHYRSRVARLLNAVRAPRFLAEIP